MERILQRSIRFITERGILVVDERADSDHLRLQIPHIQKISNDIVPGLIRTSNHDPAADLIADGFQVAEAALAVPDGKLRRMKPGIMFRI